MSRPPAGVSIPTIDVTDAIRVRPLREQDLDAFDALHDDPDVWQAFGWSGPRNRGQNGQLLGASRNGESDFEGAYKLAFAIEDRSSNPHRMVGIVVFVVAKGLGDLTVAIAPAARGQGVGPRVLPPIFEWCRAKAGIELIVGVAKPNNARSIKMMQKAGMADLGEQEAKNPATGEIVKVREFNWPPPSAQLPAN